MNYLKLIFIRIISLNLIFLFLMSVVRTVFFFYYSKGLDFTGLSSDILKAFYMGVRYDSAVLAYLNIPVTLAMVVLLFSAGGKCFKKALFLLKYYYSVFVVGLFVLLCVDFGFYSYFQNHLNILIYGLFEDDTSALFSTLSENYNLPLVIFGFIAIYVFIFMVSKRALKIEDVKQSITKSIPAKICILLALMFLNFIIARGSFGIFPLGVDDAEISKNTFLNKIAINGVYTLQAAMEARKKENRGFDFIAETGYKDNIRQAFADFLGKDYEEISKERPELSLAVKLPVNKDIENIRPNVILIMMESMGSDLIKWNSDKFNVLGGLKKHFDEDLVFYNFLPGHEGTIGSLEAAITNIANKPLSKNLSQSKYAYNKYRFSGPIPYKGEGYETTFIYGGNTGWRNVGNYMPNLNFDFVLGEGAMKKEYPRNQWGVYDEYLFDFVFDTLDSGDKKKFIYVLSTSNHPPYSLPDDYSPLSLEVPANLEKKITGKDLALKRFRTYQYSNEMLGRFITRIKNSKYADNTIVAVTGDHNFWNVFSYPQDELFGSLSVPFYLYIPQKLKPADADVSVFGSHIDIMPTLYGLSVSNAYYMAMGKNLLSEEAKNNIAFTDNETVADKTGIAVYSLKNREASYYAYKKCPWQIAPSGETEAHKRLVKHYLAAIAVSDYLIKNAGE